jgi:hypothetical protein
MKRALLVHSHPPERSIADGQCWDLTVMGVYRLRFLYPAVSQPHIKNFCPNSRKALASQSPRRGDGRTQNLFQLANPNSE